MEWYNWYYGINEPVVVEVEEVYEATKKEVEATPHDFPSCNFLSVAELESQQENVVEVEICNNKSPKKKHHLKNYHLRK
jgi:hypothetical protein